ncbi:hypothetical protein [Nocardia sp. NPDC052566]|uniref:hypothetical protein n=1 Tax=Nocardia sp. NPDC052566 TaxID=3364330 RepID=UPI0037C7E87E
MKKWIVVVVDLVLTALCLLGAVASWRGGLRHTVFSAVGEIPAFEATRYSAPWLLLAAVLVAVGGLLAIDGVARAVGVLRR